MAIQVDQTDRDSVNQAPDQPTRRSFLTKAGVGAGAFAVGAMLQTAQVDAQTSHSQSNAAAAPGRGEFWPDGARLVISISMQFEAGGQPRRGPTIRSRRSISRRVSPPIWPPKRGLRMDTAKGFPGCWISGIVTM